MFSFLLGELVALAVLSALVGIHPAWRERVPSGLAASVMAIGIFILATLPRLPFSRTGLIQLCALELIVIWGALAASYGIAWLRGISRPYVADPVERFATGTWIAATTVLGDVIIAALPAWRILAVCCAVLALFLWLWFLVLAIGGFRALIVCPPQCGVNGAILLTTVSTQSLVILAIDLYHRQVPQFIEVGGIWLGVLFYMMGMVVIARQYLSSHLWRLTDDWPATNCIIHGALSITGLAMAVTQVLPDNRIVWVWLGVVVVFAFIESIETLRLVERQRVYGWRRGVLTYHPTQWARNFTFGMLYAFTLSMPPVQATRSIPTWLAGWHTRILNVGPYIVLALLILEVGLWAMNNPRWRSVVPLARRG